MESSTDKLTLKAWLDAVVANARGVFDGVSFWELTETRLADPQLASLTVATSLLERVESLLPGLGAETSEWLPFLKIPVGRAESLSIVRAEELSFPADLGDASLCIDKSGQLFFWGSWESYQSTRLLVKEGFPDYRLMWHSSINDREREFSWETYNNSIFIFRSDRMYA